MDTQAAVTHSRHAFCFPSKNTHTVVSIEQLVNNNF